MTAATDATNLIRNDRHAAAIIPDLGNNLVVDYCQA